LDTAANKQAIKQVVDELYNEALSL
jgi:hypothetical protein